MGFWIFMLISVLLIPLSMIFFGKYYKDYEPKAPLNLSGHVRKSQLRRHSEIKYLSGYRTRRSMKNDDTFVFAQKVFGEIWLKSGYIILIPSLIPMFYIYGATNKDLVGMVGGLVVFIQLIVMCFPIYFVEKALKKNFDENGKRIEYF